MLTADQIRQSIPRYLTSLQQEELVRQLNDFENRDYYTSCFPDEMLQGDGWSRLEILRFENGSRDKVKGILLSNSCDIDPANSRDLPARVVFAPLVHLDAYRKLLEVSLSAEQINNKLTAIRRQHVTSLFFLPRGAQLEAECIAILDDLHTIPLHVFQKETQRVKLFTLTQMGFYLFVLKLSIHFCRFQDGVIRS
jgi:hypothetical protein